MGAREADESIMGGKNKNKKNGLCIRVCRVTYQLPLLPGATTPAPLLGYQRTLRAPTNAQLHSVITGSNRPLGFDLSEREVKRAGLDHWNHVDLTVHDSWRCFTESTFPTLGHGDDTDSAKTSIYLVSKRLKLGSTPIAEVNFFPPTPTPPLPGVLAGSAGGDSSDAGASGRLKLGSNCFGGSNDSSSRGDGGSNSGGDGSFSEDVALVFGNEVDGLSGLEEGAKGRSLPAVFLPMRDTVIRSYNLANAVAMAVYEVDRQRRESRLAREESAAGVGAL